MSRCKACDTPLMSNDKPAWNKLANAEEDLCSVCRSMSFGAYTDHEYICGRYPVDGLRGPTPTQSS